MSAVKLSLRRMGVTFVRSADATMRTVRFIVGTSKVARFLWGLSVVLLVTVLYACTAAQRQAAANDASALAPYLDAGCAVVKSLGNPWVDYICDGAEAVDNLVAQIPGAQVVSSTNVVDASGAPLRTLYRVRCPLASFTKVADAAASDVVTAADVVRAIESGSGP